MDEIRFLIVVGRAESSGSFFNDIAANLIHESFIIEGVHSLDEFSDVDKKDRYIAFLSSPLDEDDFHEKASGLSHIFTDMGYSCKSFDSLEEAFEYAAEKYDFESDDVMRQEQMLETRKKFPHFTAEEWEQLHVFEALFLTGKVKPIPARYNDERAIVLAQISFGSDMVRVTPMMMLITDEIHEELEIPFK